MKDLRLSKQAMALLEENGYKVLLSEEKILFKKPYDYLGPIILFIVFAFVALPLFYSNYWLGALIFTTLVVGVFMHRHLISKTSTFQIYPKESRIEINDRQGQRWFTYWYINSLFIRSIFTGEYASGHKSTTEDYLIVIGVELKSKELVDFFYLQSDFREPNEEMNEIHDFLKELFKSS